MTDERWAISVEETIAEDVEEGGEAVLPADFFPLSVSSSMIRDRHFIDAAPQLGEFNRNFWFETEAPRVNPDLLDNVRTKDLIANLHVREIKIGNDVAQGRKEAIAEIVPKVKHPVRTAVEAVPENHVCLPLKKWLQERGIVSRVVFEVSILDEDNLPCNICDGSLNGTAFAEISVVEHDLQHFLLALQVGFLQGFTPDELL
jgi:hypothetical protein